ncbi:hypothetical protein DRY87_26620, partial [Salmonella enterica subsp. enterica serovar Newport]|nr:hypothetical protein [Salmonella enterica subsp. enterica serovar Newport]
GDALAPAFHERAQKRRRSRLAEADRRACIDPLVVIVRNVLHDWSGKEKPAPALPARVSQFKLFECPGSAG